MIRKNSSAVVIIWSIFIFVTAFTFFFFLEDKKYNQFLYSSKNNFNINLNFSFSDFVYYINAEQALLLKDIKNSELFYTLAIDNGTSTNEPYLLRNALIISLLYGEYAFGKKPAMEIQESIKNEPLSSLVLLMDSLQKNNTAELDIVISSLKANNTIIDATIISIIKSHELLDNNPSATLDEAIAILEPLKNILPIIYYFESGILAVKMNEKDLAKEYFDQAMPQSTPDMIIYYLKYLKSINELDEIDKVSELYLTKRHNFAKNISDKIKHSSSNEKIKHDNKTALSYFLGIMGTDVNTDKFAFEKIVYLKMAVFLNSGLDFAILSLANSLKDSGSYDDAIKILSICSRKSLLYLESLSLKAEIETEQNDRTAAIKTLFQIQKLDNNNLTVIIQRGILEQSIQKYRRAIDTFSEAIIIAEKTKANDNIISLIYYYRALAYSLLGNTKLAEIDSFKSLSYNPNNIETLNFLGYSWVLENRNLEEALSLIEKSLSKAPNSSHILDSYGWALFLLGRPQESIVYLEKSIELDPIEPESIDHLADNYWKLGRINEAQYQWKYALTLNPNIILKNQINNKLNGIMPSYLDKNQVSIVLYPQVSIIK